MRDKRLRIVVSMLRQVFAPGSRCHLRWEPTHLMLADGLTKIVGIAALCAFAGSTAFKHTPPKKKTTVAAAFACLVRSSRGEATTALVVGPSWPDTCAANEVAASIWDITVDLRLFIFMAVVCLIFFWVVLRKVSTIYLWLCGRPFRIFGRAWPGRPAIQRAAASSQTDLDVAELLSTIGEQSRRVTYLEDQVGDLREEVDSLAGELAHVNYELERARRDHEGDQAQIDLRNYHLAEQAELITDLRAESRQLREVLMQREPFAEPPPDHPAPPPQEPAAPPPPQAPPPPRAPPPPKAPLTPQPARAQPAAAPPPPLPQGPPVVLLWAGEVGPANRIRGWIQWQGYPAGFREEMSAVNRAIVQLDLTHCNAHFLDFLGSNHYWIRAKCVVCRELVLRYRAVAPLAPR